jgi:HlyD family secretion protein
MSKKRIFLIAIGLVFIVVIITAVLNRGNKSSAIEVQTSQVQKQKIVQTVSATGRIQPKTQVKISADVAAKITELAVEEGDWVEKGQLLVRLDREKYEAAVERVQANVRSAEADAKLAKENMLKAEKDFDRTRSLFERNLESQAAMDQTSAAYKVEKARYQSSLELVEQARALLKQAQDDLSKTTIYAPMSGTISALNKEEGEIALGSQFQEDVIMIISDLGGMEALVDVDENDIVSVSLGDSASIEVDALPDKVFHGVVTEIASSAKVSGVGSVDQKTDFEVAVRTPEQLKKVEQPAKGDIAIADDSAAQIYKPDKDGFVQVVFVVKKGQVTAQQVKTGIQSETHIEVIDGLNEGNEIVIGNYRAISQDLKNGSKIVIQNSMSKR